MEIKLTKEESEEYFYNALCNGGFQSMLSSGIELESLDNDYSEAKKILKEKKPNEAYCYEDVYMQILRNGKKLRFIDNEGGEYTREISLIDIHEKVCKMPEKHLLDYVNENDDATTADVLLQTVLYGEIIFG